MGAMSIVSHQAAQGSEMNTDSIERSWLDTVKAAANLEIYDTKSHDTSEYPAVVEQAWIQTIKDPKDFRRVKVYDYLGDILQKVEKSVDNDKQASRHYDEECELVRKLLGQLELRTGFTEAFFFTTLKTYFLKLQNDLEGRNQVSELNRKKDVPVEVSDRRIASRLVWKYAPIVGPGLISALIECSISLHCWSMIESLLRRRVVDSRDCSKIVESAIQNQMPMTLCLCISHAADLAPQDVYSMLVYFLDNLENTPRSFLKVKGEWKRLALQKIKAFSKTREGSSSGVRRSSATLLGLAKAVDNFSVSELCLHHLVAMEQDEAVISSVLSKLDTPQLLNLLQYLRKWIDQYSSQLGNYTTLRIGRIPSLNQVFSWISTILEGNYTQFVLSPQFHPVLGEMKGLLQPLVALYSELTPLLGVVAHVRHRRGPAATKPRSLQVPQAPSDYIIELLDLGGE
ncbi:hypothetical protein R1sor_011708 [Riccia sorocarpa]|uniref:Nucleolar protein 11 C-terminal domain-containing protein n=1 Tax=Riccia sorocarpa TaxID=122646 RepID=A0ABD3I5M2_9MARC